MDGSKTASASMKSVTVSGTTTTKKEMPGNVVQVSGCNVVFQLDTTKDATNVMAEKGSYEFVLSGVPTTESKAGADAMALGSMVLSVGLYSKGSYGWSSAPLFNALKTGTLPTGLNLLEFASATATVSRGTYTKSAVCIKPATGNFKADVSVSVVGTTFKTSPTNIAAKMGDAQACAAMGTASTTQTSTHFVTFKVNNGTTTYTGLPTLKATVDAVKATVTVPTAVTCSKGGSSVPMVVKVSALPFTDVKVSLEQSIAKDEKKTNNSEGITVNTGDIVTLTVSNPEGVLGFKCGATVKGTELLYKIDGADKSQYTIAAKLTVTAIDKPKTQPKAAMALAMDASPASTAA